MIHTNCLSTHMHGDDRERPMEYTTTAIAVKPLEWRPEPPYHVTRVFGNVYAVEAWDGGATLSGVGGRRDFKTLSEAKAAAQADYEARILSALSLQGAEKVNGTIREILWEIRKSVKNARGAIESNQVVDKDVHGTLTSVISKIDLAIDLDHTAPPTAKRGEVGTPACVDGGQE